MSYKILRCGRCGCFCDNTGRVFEASKQLIKADEAVGFEDSIGECNKCGEPSLYSIHQEQLLSDELAVIRGKANEYMSTGK